MSRELKDGMKWSEFRDLLVGISPDTALGRVVAIRAETDEKIIKRFSKAQHRIWDEWRRRRAQNVSEAEIAQVLEGFKQTFIELAGGGNH